jgi:hypothetical protein
MKHLEVFEVNYSPPKNFSFIDLLSWDKNIHKITLHSYRFHKGSLVTVLTSSSSLTKDISFFNWLCVTPYLTRDEEFTTLCSLRRLLLRAELLFLITSIKIHLSLRNRLHKGKKHLSF